MTDILSNSTNLQDIFVDPISLELIEEAVISSTCGHSFSNETISDWLKKNSKCPLCLQPLLITDLTPNYTLRDAIKLLKVVENDGDNKGGNLNTSQQNLNKLDDNQISNQLEEIQKQIKFLLQQQSNPQNPQYQQQATQPIVTGVLKPIYKSNSLIREIWSKESDDASILMERATSTGDEFMDYFFGEVSWRKNAAIWYCCKMVDYALKRARVWGLFSNNTNSTDMKGIMICQPPYEVGVSITQMLKVGMMGAPFKMGVQPLARVLKTFELTDRIHNEITSSIPHWYINCIMIDPSNRNSKLGSELLSTVLKLADSQKVHCYTEVSNQNSINFFLKHGFTLIKSVDNTVLPFTFHVLMRDPQPI